MNTERLKKGIGFASVLGILLFTACSSNETIEEEVLSVVEVENMVLADDISSEIDNILDQDEVDISFGAKTTSKTATTTSGIASCATRTVDESAGEKTVTIDFGTSCVGNNGKEYAGKIIIVYTRTSTQVTKVVSFENFSINGNTVAGGKTSVRIKENANGNPTSTITVNMTITFENGDTMSRTGEKVREKIEGAATRVRGDDVYLISGAWVSVDKEGVEKTATITTSLRREYACRFIVSGVVEFSRGDTSGSLDFGDGSCDNKATFTDANGDVKEITLRRR